MTQTIRTSTAEERLAAVAAGQLITLSTVAAVTGLSRQSLLRLLRLNTGDFPRPIAISDSESRYWRAEEVADWLRNQLAPNMGSLPERKLLSTRRLAQAIGLPRRAIEAWRSSRLNPVRYIVVGRQRRARYCSADVAAWLQRDQNGDRA